MSDPTSTDYEVLVIGGGAAGLSGAIALARFRRSVAVIDAGQPRNAPADHVHNLLARENISPLELVAAGRRELLGYGGVLIEAAVSAVERDAEAGDFVATLGDGRTVRGRRVLVASGLVDTLPDVAGVADLWGGQVLHCPFCHGYEVRDQRVGILATGPPAAHQAMMFRLLTDDVTVFAHTAELSDQLRDQLGALDIAVVDGEVRELVRDGDRLTGVGLADGTVHSRDAVVISTTLEARAEFLAPLGLTTEPVELQGIRIGSKLVADPRGATSVPGVWAAGNVTDPMAQVAAASAAGLTAGGAIIGDLIAERLATATPVG